MSLIIIVNYSVYKTEENDFVPGSGARGYSRNFEKDKQIINKI